MVRPSRERAPYAMNFLSPLALICDRRGAVQEFLEESVRYPPGG
jgi:hypothetical protein